MRLYVLGLCAGDFFLCTYISYIIFQSCVLLCHVTIYFFDNYALTYRELSKCPGGEQLAKDTFAQNKDFYHKIAATMIEKDLGLVH